MRVGRVALVGAGPGDPALLTIRAVELLRAADVVAHDELVSESILALAPARAQLICVGRRAGRGDTGYRLHPDILEHARAGRFVVRLKSGDPLVFGRGGEEAEELKAAGIPFEIVPGITAALGAAAYGAIPLTHREHASQVVFSTGHRGDGGLPPPETIAGLTLVLYMAARDLAANLGAVVAAGWPPSTPAALVVAATTADERTATGTLATLFAVATAQGLLASPLPALVFAGDVVALRGRIDWRTNLPLDGRRIVIRAARSAHSGITTALRTLGAEVLELLPQRPEEPLSAARWPSRVDLVVLVTFASVLPSDAAAARGRATKTIVCAEEEGVESVVTAALLALRASTAAEDPSIAPPPERQTHEAAQ